MIVQSPSVFVTCAALFFAFGFFVGKLFFGTVADVAKARLEAARDDLARLERSRAAESKDASFMRAELAGLRADFERLPKITVGAGPPTFAPGRDGDMYIQVEPSDHKPAETESGLFLHPPFTDLTAALQSAAQSNRPVFAVIYDAQHPTRSKLAYSLGYFLEYQTTRKLVDEYFVAALVPSSDPVSSVVLPSDDPLENCRWVVMDGKANVIRSEGLYANADEGLKRTREAIAAWDARAKNG